MAAEGGNSWVPVDGNGQVGWVDAAWITSIGIAFVIVAVSITFVAIMILASLSLAKMKIVQRAFWNFVTSFAASFLNLFLLFGAVFAFPAVLINTVFVTAVYAMDLRDSFRSCT
mmetsp:Transcript_13863/g.21622  ORF Transcript_13863/g.21622 Transcript_13863/m.21622 type:complete len:114 (-) Transcript_13863:456-797(-)